MYISHDRIWAWIAWHLPKRLALWCFIRVATYAAHGVDEYVHFTTDEAEAVSCLAAIKQWDPPLRSE